MHVYFLQIYYSEIKTEALLGIIVVIWSHCSVCTNKSKAMILHIIFLCFLL